ASELQIKHLPVSTDGQPKAKAQLWPRLMSRRPRLSVGLTAAGIALLLVLLAAAGVIASRFYFASEKEHHTLSTLIDATPLKLPFFWQASKSWPKSTTIDA